MPKKNIMREFVIGEISAVDRPAQKHAKMTIMKRDEIDKNSEAIIKYYVHGDAKAKTFNDAFEISEQNKRLWEVRTEINPLLDALNESIHSTLADKNVSFSSKAALIETSVNDFLSTLREKMPDVEDEITKFIVDSIDNCQKVNKKESEMTDKPTIEDLTKSLDEVKSALEKAEASLKESEVLAKMSDAEKKYMDKMSDDEKAAWMKMSAEDRKSKIDGVKKNDETLEVAGKTIAKSDVGEVAFAVFKAQADEMAEVRKAAEKDREDASVSRLAKRASDEMPGITGTDDEKAAVLKAVEAVTDEAVRKSLEAIIKVANAVGEGALDTIGKNGGDVTKSIDEKIEAAAVEIAKRDNISKSAAIAKAWVENPDLYKEYEEAK